MMMAAVPSVTIAGLTVVLVRPLRRISDIRMAPAYHLHAVYRVPREEAGGNYGPM
jgi:hypothetical protein